MTILLYSGNFGLGHELDTVLRAVHALNGDTNLRVLLVGKGKGLTETRRLAAELGLANIEFRPPVPLYGLAELLASGDIHLVSQKPGTEGFIVPSKIYGALAVGRPVIFIGPEHCEAARIVHDGRCGFVVAPGDVESASQVLRQLVLDVELRTTMGQRAKRYYAEKFGRKRSVARIIGAIEGAGGNGCSDHLAADPEGLQTTHNRSRPKPVVAALVASLLVFAYGLTYHALAAKLGAPVLATPIASDALKRFPMQFADWGGDDIPMDEEIARATDTDVHISRRYSRNNGLESVTAFVGCNGGAYERVIHRPEICYARAGWTLRGRRTVELSLPDGTKLPCSIFQFSRGELNIERVTALHYYIVDGRPCGDLSLLQSKLWRLGGAVNYLGRVLIASPNEFGADDSSTERVCAFAIDSAASIAQLFQELPTDGGCQ